MTCIFCTSLYIKEILIEILLTKSAILIIIDNRKKFHIHKLILSTLINRYAFIYLKAAADNRNISP